MVGILIANAETITVPPSEHFEGLFSPGSTSASVRALVGRFIDGYDVEPDGDVFDIIPDYPGYVDQSYARVHCIDPSPGVDRCFLVHLWARDRPRGRPWDGRGVPRLLDDVIKDGRWEIYNCKIALHTARWPPPALGRGAGRSPGRT